MNRLPPISLRLIVFFWVGLAAGSEQPVPRALSGFITQIEGAVEIVGPGTRGLPSASLWQIIQQGTTVRVPKGGFAGIVCSTHHFVRLRGPVAWSLLPSACAGGKELTPSEYTLIVPQGGRFKVVEGLLVIEREIRSGDGDDLLAPVVLKPRNSTLRSPRPTISWSHVPSATEYEFRWSGRGTSGYNKSHLLAGEVTCTEEQDGISMCSLPWPQDRADLPPGEIFYLEIAARSGIADPWYLNKSVKFQTQRLAEAEDLERRLSDLSFNFQGAALDVARAGLLAERGLYSDAADLYRRALVEARLPESRVTLADLYFAMGLHLLAKSRYIEALAEAEPAVRAAATFGLGRTAYAADKYLEAAASFRQAHELYYPLGLVAESEAALQAEDKAMTKHNKKRKMPLYPTRPFDGALFGRYPR